MGAAGDYSVANFPPTFPPLPSRIRCVQCTKDLGPELEQLNLDAVVAAAIAVAATV